LKDKGPFTSSTLTNNRQREVKGRAGEKRSSQVAANKPGHENGDINPKRQISAFMSAKPYEAQVTIP